MDDNDFQAMINRPKKVWSKADKRFFHLNSEDFEGTTLIIPDSGFKPTVTIGSAWVTHNDESTLVVSVMGMQSGKISWGVMYTECDGYVSNKTGCEDRPENYNWYAQYKAVEKKINEAIFQFLRCEIWPAR